MSRRSSPVVGLVLLTVGCGGTLDAGRDVPHGLLPVDERNPVILYQDDWSGDWLGEYAVLLAKTIRKFDPSLARREPPCDGAASDASACARS